MLGLHCGSSVYRGMNAGKRHAHVPRTRSLRGEPAAGTNPQLALDAPGVQLVLQQPDRGKLGIAAKIKRTISARDEL
jgi:hypothetical protein